MNTWGTTHQVHNLGFRLRNLKERSKVAALPPYKGYVHGEQTLMSLSPVVLGTMRIKVNGATILQFFWCFRTTKPCVHPFSSQVMEFLAVISSLPPRLGDCRRDPWQDPRE